MVVGTFPVNPIGWVRKSALSGCMDIEILPEHQEGLYRIDLNETLLVLFIFDRSTTVDLLVHPRGDPRNPLVGVFASRSPNRPNHIGATAVRLVKREGNVLTVEGLDAWEGTPVVDIKPDRRSKALEPDPSMVKTN
ncbi:MAG: tRNA (N6-threonylcarbamoyladenosine(37)-N6)-methyltransferase TrmO [Methanomassiliicoccus sp.]|nr:tRNA (N6-threonylcarbamoyladenosine(37)-N6)-methyltransferase TrmO [Methanomassiliicoccus sp.]